MTRLQQRDAPARGGNPVRSRGRVNVWVAGGLGLVLGAGLVGGVWIVGGDDGGGGSGGPVDGAALAAPETLGEYQQLAQAAQDSGLGNVEAQIQQGDAEDEASGELLAEAYGGAGAVVERYADGGWENIVHVFAVRAGTPEPFVPHQDIEAMALAVPTRELVRVGEVACAVTNQPLTPAGQEPEPDSVNVEYCQRASGTLTVQVRVISGDIRHDPEQLAALVDDAWSALT